MFGLFSLIQWGSVLVGGLIVGLYALSMVLLSHGWLATEERDEILGTAYSMNEDWLGEFSEVVGEKEAYLTALDAETRSELVPLLNSCLYGHVGPHDLFNLVLVMLELRPACVISAKRDALSEAHAEEMAQDLHALTACELVGQFLETYDIPFILTTYFSEGWTGRPAEVYLNYHVSFDEERLVQYAKTLSGEGADLVDAVESEEVTNSGLSRADEQALGELLGYPESAIEAYCDRDHIEGERLVDALSDDELTETLGSLVDIYDAMDLDYREFTKLILPYVVPETASDCTDRIRTDVTRVILGGLLAREEYGITLFEDILADYRDRFAPEI